MAMVKDLLEDSQDDAICIECSNIIFTSNKSTQPPESNDLIIPHKVSVSSAPNDTDTSDINKELNTYKDRLALELYNCKKQLEMHSKIKVECAKQNMKSQFNHKLRHQTLTQTETMNTLRQQIDQLGAQLQHQQVSTQHMHPVLPQTPPFQDTTQPPPPQYHYSHNVSPKNNSLVEVMDVLNRSMTNQYMVLQETLRQSQSASKEHYLSNAQSFDGKNPKEFGMWLDEDFRLATICDMNLMGVALAISKGTLHKYINELVSSGMSWLPITAQLQERFSECRIATMAKHKLT